MVMGTGVLSIALRLDARRGASDVLLGLAAVFWSGLVVIAVYRLARDRARFLCQVRTPGALTAIAGTAVLGSGLALLGWRTVPAALLVISCLLWVALIVPVVRDRRAPMVGAWFLLTVSTEALAVLAAALATRQDVTWLAYAALVPFALGLAIYPMIVIRFDFRQLRVGAGDHWISGGALAIAALAAGLIAIDARRGGALAGAAGACEELSLGLWAVAILWVPALLLAEATSHRVRYDPRRWSTVFPVGMYAAASFIVGTAADVDAISSFARIWVWVALAIWVVVFTGMLLRGSELIAGANPSDRARFPRSTRSRAC
jgi:tellurite resistance protein TehA-like permease